MFFKISAFYFSYFSVIGIYVIFLPMILSDLKYTTLQIGIVFALAPLMRFLTPFLFLKHIKLTNELFKKALFLYLISCILMYFTIENFYLFCINNILFGVLLSLILPFADVIALTVLKGQRYGKARLYGSLGFMLIALMLPKYLTSHIVALNYFMILSLFIVFFSVLLIKYEDKKTLENLDVKEDEKFSLIRYWPFWASLFFMQVSFGGFYNFFTIYEASYGFSLDTIGYMWSVGIVFEIIMLYFQAPFLKNNLLLVIKISIFATVLRWLIVYLYPDNLEIIIISQTIHALSFGLYHSAVMIYLLQLYKNKRLAQQFLYGIAYGLGAFVGALVSGVVYGEYLFLYSSVFAFLAFIVLFYKNEHNYK